MVSRGRFLVQLACEESETDDNNEELPHEKVVQHPMDAIPITTFYDSEASECTSNMFSSHLPEQSPEPGCDQFITDLPVNILNLDDKPNRITTNETLDFSSDSSSSYHPDENSENSDSESEETIQNISGNHDNSNETPPVMKRKRNRKAQPQNWKRNRAKKSRIGGQEYINRSGKIIPKKYVKNTDCSKCRYKCNENFNDDLRKIIFEEYRALSDTTKQKQYLSSLITVGDVVRRRQNAKNPKKLSKQYHFRAPGGALIRVCMKFLCNTLSISHRILDTLIVSSTGNYSSNDKRAGKKPATATSVSNIAAVKSHIDSFPRMESHYCRRDSKKLYLASDLNISIMYRLYKEQIQEMLPVSYYVYKQIFHSYDPALSFYQPKKDQCTKCNAYNASSNKDDLKDEWAAHKARENTSMKMKHSDKIKAQENHGKTFGSVSFDLQSILTLPFAGDSAIYYKRKLNAYNFTIYENHSRDGYCYVWDECNAQKGSNEIATCLFKYLESLPDTVTHVSSFSDTCGGQNRNKHVCAAMLYAVNNLSHLETIDLKYMESGHSYLEADAMHATIERARKHKKNYTTREWALLISAARINPNPYIVNVLNNSDFYDFKLLTNQVVHNTTKNIDKDTVNWLKIKWLRFTKTKPNIIMYKYDLDEENFMEININQKRNAKAADWQQDIILNKAYNKTLPITEAKKNDFLSLLDAQVIPRDYAYFYHSLPSSSRMFREVDSEDEE